MNDEYDTQENPHINARFGKQQVFLLVLSNYVCDSFAVEVTHNVFFLQKNQMKHFTSLA